MDERDFALLSTLQECNNISHAADRLSLTQSALSKRIKAIERELGCTLLIRTSKGVRFTPEGEVVLEHTARIRHELHDLRSYIDSTHDEVCGSLSAGFSVNYAALRLPKLLAEYHRSYPLVRLDVKTGRSLDLIKQLQASQLDVAVVRGELPWDGKRYLLAEERVCVARAHELEQVPLGELTYICHITDSSQSALMQRWLRENGLTDPKSTLNVADLHTCMRLVELGVGWALLPDIILEEFDGAVHPCTFANGEAFMRRMYICCHRETYELPQVDAMIDLIRKGYGA